LELNNNKKFDLVFILNLSRLDFLELIICQGVLGLLALQIQLIPKLAEVYYGFRKIDKVNAQVLG